MQRSLRVLYFAVNLACVAVFLYAGYRVSSQMRLEQRTESDGVDGITFIVFAAPAFLAALLANVIWLAKALVDVSRHEDFRALKWLGVGVGIWVIAILGGRLL